MAVLHANFADGFNISDLFRNFVIQTAQAQTKRPSM